MTSVVPEQEVTVVPPGIPVPVIVFPAAIPLQAVWPETLFAREVIVLLPLDVVPFTLPPVRYDSIRRPLMIASKPPRYTAVPAFAASVNVTLVSVMLIAAQDVSAQ